MPKWSPVTIQLLMTSHHKRILLLRLSNLTPEVHGLLSGCQLLQWDHHPRQDFVLSLGILRLLGQRISMLIMPTQNIVYLKVKAGKK